MTPATIVHFVATPARLGEQGASGPLELTKAAPYFRPLDIEVVDLGGGTEILGGESVTISRQIFDGEVLVTEARWTLEDAVGDTGPPRRAAVQTALRRLAGVAREFLFEEYVVIGVCPPVTPDQFVKDHEPRLAPLLRQEATEVSKEEASHILASRVRYSDRDLAVIDWDGALLLDADGQFESDLALLKLGNTQLLRYRMLDRRIDEQLEHVRKSLTRRRRVTAQRRELRAVLQTRLDLLLDNEGVEQLLVLIGDWYTAELYRVIVDEFYINEWRTTVHAKLDELHTITDSIAANLSVSWQQAFDVAQLIGWAVLLAGYFVLFFLEITRR